MGAENGTGDVSGKYGEKRKHDKKFKGPIQNRSCTDIICLILFLVCFLLFLAVGFLAFASGNPEALLYPADSEGNRCGTGDFSDRPYVFFFDLTQCAKVGPAILIGGCPTPQICVDKCPSSYWHYSLTQVPTQTQSPADAADKLYCKYDVQDTLSTTTETVKQLVKNGDCAAFYLDSEPLAGRCVPKAFTDILDSLGDLNLEDLTDAAGNLINQTQLADTEWITTILNAQAYAEKFAKDVQNTWPLILIGIGVGAVISLLMIFLMRWVAKPLVWITIIAFLVLFGFACYYTFSKYVELRGTSNVTSINDVQLSTSLDYYAELEWTWLVLGIASAILLLIVLLMVIFLRTRIQIAIAIISEASRTVVGGMMFSLLWPLFPFLIYIILFAYWGVSALYIASMGKDTYGNSTQSVEILQDISNAQDEAKNLLDSIPCDPNSNSTEGQICNFLKVEPEKYAIYLQIYQLFMLFWTLNFVAALGQMTLAGAFASWYFTFDKKDVPTFPIAASLYRCFRYHLGTIAFGSLIIALIQLIRVLLEYLDYKLKETQNAVSKFIMKCLKCCFWCLEKFMKFLNKNAYIVCAIYGKNFCVSAKDAFFLLMRNIVRVVVIDKVTDFVLFVSKLVVVGAVGALTYFTFSGDITDRFSWFSYITSYIPDNLNYYLVPVILIIIGTYFVAAAFFSVYGMAVDTLFLCFLEDVERNDGSAEKPYYMNKELSKILGKKNKKKSTEEDTV